MNFRKIYESSNSKIKNLKETKSMYTRDFIFQKVYENDDMIEVDTSYLEKEIDDYDALNIATCYLQDYACDEFEGWEGDDEDEFEDEFRDWFIANSEVELDDEMVEEYKGIEPSDRF